MPLWEPWRVCGEYTYRMGPNLIIDKSFLQSLTADQVFELSLWFRIVCVPTLVSEIIADLKLPPTQKGRVPESVVRALAQKMAHAPGLRPIEWRKAVRGELRGSRVLMTGQVVVDSAADNVLVSRLGIMYDAVPEQKVWARWASGDFSTDDQETAAAWRAGIAEIDLAEVGEAWRPFAEDRLGTPKTMRDLVHAVDDFMRDSTSDSQSELMRLGLSVAGAPEAVQAVVLDAVSRRPDWVLTDRAPFLASIVRLTLTMLCGLPRGFVGPRETNAIDLQYLYYTPFCQVFASSDKLHRSLWRATTTDATFLWGPDLRDDLRQRAEIRLGMSIDEWAEYREPYGMHPPPRDCSVVNAVWDQIMVPIVGLPGPTPEPGELDAETRDLIDGFLKSVGRG